MKTLQKPYRYVTANLPLQHIEEGVEYVRSRYLIEVDNALYNPLTEEAVLVENLEEDREYLIKHWFYIPNDMDLSSVSRVLRQKYLSNNSGPGSRLKKSYVIFVTTTCNASCTYCFEKNFKPITMTEDTALKVADYIKRTKIDGEIKIKWFGGEPLLNKKAIKVICDKLKEEGINYWSEISSNGDLFPSCTDEEILNWNARIIQFTVDELDKEYDRVKGLPKGAIDRLKDTIIRLGELIPECRINIRIHYDPERKSDICYKIVDEFLPFKNVKMYSRMLYGSETLEDYKELIRVEDYIIDRGKHEIFKKPYGYGNHCMADAFHISCITPTGDLSPCEHFAYGDHVYGSIYSKDRNEDILKKWTIREKYTKPECKECPLYPSCRKIVMCPAEGKCSEGYQYYQIETIKRALRKKVEEINGRDSNTNN